MLLLFFRACVRFDYARLEEEGAAANSERVREVYERAVAMVPPVSTEKRFWRRYVYLWINYALFEELVAEDVGRAREVRRKDMLRERPHAPLETTCSCMNGTSEELVHARVYVFSYFCLLLRPMTPPFSWLSLHIA